MAGVLRTTTIITADVVESTALQRAIGDDVYLGLVGNLHDVARQVTEALGGTFLSTEGDGLWAAFDASIDAVTAAVRLMRATLRLDQSTPLPNDLSLALRIGVTTGDVTWNENQTDCVGLARNLAKRLEEDAAPHTIVCSDVVPFLSGAANRHRFERRGPRTFKGFDEPIQTWEVKYPGLDERPLARGLPTELHASHSDDFVGRSDELESISDAWDRVVLGSGRFLAISGEAGAGKSALCCRAATDLLDRGAIVLYGRVDEQLAYPFQPYIEAIRDFLQRAVDNPALVQTTLGPSSPELSLIVPELADRADGAPPQKRDFNTQRHMLFEAVANWIRRLAMVNPVLLVLDDLTWVDEQTLAMTRHLVRRTTGDAVLVLGTYRPAEVTDHFEAARAATERLAFFRELGLSGLSETEVFDLVQRAAPGVDAAKLHEHTGGNPFYVRELLREIERDATAVGSSRSDRRSKYRTPRAVKDLVSTRARRLQETTGDMLAAAAVSGAAWSVEPLRQVLKFDEATMAHAVSEAEAVELIRPGRRVRGATSWGFTHAIIRDAIYEQIPLARREALHRVIAEVLEHRWRSGQVAPLRGRSSVEAVSETSAADVAYHYRAAGGSPDKVIEFSLAAADEASTRFAYDGAVGHLDVALRALDDLTEVAPGLESFLLFRLGVAQRRAGRRVVIEGPRGETADTLLLASSMAADEGNGELCARAVLAGSRGIFTSTGETVHVRLQAIDRALGLVADRTALRASLLGTKAVELTFGDEFRQRFDGETVQLRTDEEKRASELQRIRTMKGLAQQGVDIAREVVGSDPRPERLGPLIEALALQVVALWRPADLDERLLITAQLQVECAKFNRPQATLNAATSAAQAAMEHGDFQLADIHMRTISESASELRQPTVLGYAFLRQAMRRSVDGDFDESERLAKKSFGNATDAGHPDARAFYVGQIFNLRYHQGRLGEVADELSEVADGYPGIIAFRAAMSVVGAELGDVDLVARSLSVIYGPDGCGVPNDLNWMATTALSAEAAAWSGDQELCRRLIRELTPVRHLFVDNASTFFGSIERYIALASSAVGDISSASTSFEAALEAHRGRAPVLLARTELEYSEMLLRREPDVAAMDRATRMLEHCLEDALDLGLHAIERRAKAILTEVAPPRR